MGNCSSGGVPEPAPQKKSGSGRGSSCKGNSNRFRNKRAFPPIKPQRVASHELKNPPAISSPDKTPASEVTSPPGSVRSTPRGIEDFRQNTVNNGLCIFTYGEMIAATRNFRPDKVLGEGGFGVVYKGLVDENVRSGLASTQVAVKELNPDGLQGDKEWLAEVNYLGQFSHPNLVKLIGYCCEDEHRLLVYEYMACGSLEKHLFRRVCLTMSWPTRMKIALGTAKGLAFLHEADTPLIYRDFKTSNILLDADYNAKLSDFGLAKEGPVGDQTHVSTRVMGTYGYAAPEYVMTGHLTARSDVYGYGVVLLEMLTGRRAMDKRRPGREHNLVDWARPLINHSRKLLKIIDPRMEGQYTTKTIQKVANLAYECLSQNPKTRPTMRHVVEVLESLKDLPENRDDPLLHSGGNAVTLYEVPKGTTGGAAQKEKRRLNKAESEKESSVHGSRRKKKGNRRSRSEPAMEYERDGPSPDGDNTPKQMKSSSSTRDTSEEASPHGVEV